MRITLLRDYAALACTLGILQIDELRLQTIERPWLPDLSGPGGTKGVSCVPEGLYQLVRHDSEAHPRSFALVNPDLGVYHYPEAAPLGSELHVRTLVLIHVANWASELRGCIAPGMVRHFNGNGWMVQRSREAMTHFNDRVPWENKHELLIRGTQ